MRVPDDLAARIEEYCGGADIERVARLLDEHRGEILARWLVVAGAQPFHRGRPRGAVADHLPALFDALVALTRRVAERAEAAPWDAAPSAAGGAGGGDAAQSVVDPELERWAREHARTRLEQGLAMPDVVLEFRLLRREIGRALRAYLDDAVPARAIVGAELLVHDALDSAVFAALAAMGAREADEVRHRADEERTRLLAAERRAREAAEAAVRARDQVLAAVAHDLNTPLTAIRGYAQLLIRRVARLPGLAEPDAEQLAAGLAQIQAAARKLARWLAELSDVARLQVGQPLPLDLGPVDLVALARRVAAEHQQAATCHQLRVEADVPELVGVWDEARLERVLSNLLANAVKYSPSGGEVRLTVRRAAGDWAVLEVRDRGIGIPAQDVPHVFELFRRGANAAGAVAGSGIGLASAQRIVERHGGTIGVQSELGAGTTFVVRLPLAPPVEVTAAPRSAHQDHAPPGDESPSSDARPAAPSP